MFCETKQNWFKSNSYRMNMKFSNYFSNKKSSIINNFKKIVTLLKKTNKELIVVYLISCFYVILMCYVVILVLDYLVDKGFFVAISDIIKSIKNFVHERDYEELFVVVITFIILFVLFFAPI